MEESKESGDINFNWRNMVIVLVAVVIGAFGLVTLSYIKLPSFTKNSDEDVLNFDEVDIVEVEGDNINMEGLVVEDIETGDGAESKEGNKVTVHYKGTLTDGTQFDSSYDRGEPFSLTLGAGEVIEGWDKGLVGMKVGGKRKLTIPPELGYGEAGAGDDIPPNSTLIFEVELLEVE